MIIVGQLFSMLADTSYELSIATNGREAEEDVLVIREQRIDELNHDSFSYQSGMMLLDHLLVESSFVFFVLQNQPSKLAGRSRILTVQSM